MMICKVMNVAKEWNGKTVFEHVNIEIKAGEHVALFGKNGVGKTTLLQTIAGALQPDRGTIQRFVPSSEWGCLDQHIAVVDERMTAIEFVQAGSPEHVKAKNELEKIQHRLNGNVAQGQAEISLLLERYEAAFDTYQNLNGYDWETKVERYLHTLKLDPAVWNTPFSRLSGGQKTKAQIARIAIAEPKFLVLDEPTNHLDRETLAWLEEWVRSHPGAILFVSHDRYFLDRTAHAIYELTPQGSKRYTGGYSDYKRQKDVELRTQEALYKKQEQMRQELLECIRRYQQWFDKAHKAAGQNDFYRSKAKKNVSRFKAKETALAKLEEQSVQMPRKADQLKVQLGGGEFEAQTLLRVEQVTFGYDGHPIFEELNLSVNRGDRIAVIGPNGAGKSTLLKLMTGQLRGGSGVVAHHPQLKIGYFSQEIENLDRGDSILDSLLRLPNMTQTFARTILGCFLFSRDDVFKRIEDLSMGEQCRVAFLKLYFSDANLLVLDEPTNYLDIETREKMEQAFSEYPGAIVVVSHDRYLLDRLANRIVALEEGEVVQYPGTYKEYTARGAADRTPGAMERDNELRMLELRLAQIMSFDPGEGAEDRFKWMQEARSLKERIEMLKNTAYNA
ncbi:putative ABC transporter ATP-binding protein YheS [Paenibacillus sp. CECT 9249]|uniref:ribosomal protection-like ABC-F family protein n=1 Tax=Paenibacillus sp. CECT 9249 TaxID=2845385 RepID=UPI001E5E6D97|nr:ABC-F type ribosomal protection protein [Paenibacillus sp. CECT 9249]CAH0121608.1 putative ABC transporter ATP-binding protein YheS [Paenibacillus sp. CECT 9249]